MSDHFRDLGLNPILLKNILDLGYEVPTAIQQACIPVMLDRRDLIGQAQTGTGKTAAFALPILDIVDLDSTQPQALVLTPTRELALQVAEAFQQYARNLKKFHIVPIYGGQNFSVQLKQLKRGVQVVVGTPGRIMDHIRRGTLQLDALKTFVLDEADEILNMGFLEDIEWIMEQTPAEKQVALFSATMPDQIRKVAKKHLSSPEEIKIKSVTATVSTIDQQYVLVTAKHKLDALTRIMEVEEFDAMIIFVRTRNGTVELKDKLNAHGFAAEAMHGDLSQDQRERIIRRLKKSELDILVATDVAARGLDVERISYVVNFDIPYDPESYVHRIGRTGRAGREGKALMFVTPREKRLLRAVEKGIGKSIPAMVVPGAKDLHETRVERFVDMVKETIASQDMDYYYDLLSRLKETRALSAEDIAVALTYQTQLARPFIVSEISAPVSQDKNRKQNNRKESGSRSRKTSRKSEGLDPDVNFINYRLDVGETHGASPREVVGALANEAGLEGKYIQQVRIKDEFTTVLLPEGMPKEVFQHLKKVRVCGRKLNISETNKKEDKNHGPSKKRVRRKRIKT